ncbi:hypothetical protein Tsubulata_045843 [Turnera subulata]|uniref:WRKY domain-containing protein n=1 Tax=Turnera subulata TaxID=218843 RepID=A0A9Q0J1T0_9ROSI|nr:hypothetical protein Tsubulata_045843 [Turnera subulata]
MEASWPETLPSDWSKAVNELVQGREFANQLNTILNNPMENDGSLSSQDLVTKVMNSFTNSLSILNRIGSNEEVSQSKDSAVTSKFSSVKDPTVGYKRSKRSRTWTKESTILINDGYAWRKYGQKATNNFPYPRNYFRCTYKYDQGCQATKQVQRVGEELYRTIYCGHHTCGNSLKVSQLSSDSADADSSIWITFSSNDQKDNKNYKLTKPDVNPSFTSSKSTKQKGGNRENGTLLDPKHHQYSSSSDNLTSPTFLPQFYQADLISRENSSDCTWMNSLDMDVMLGGVVFHNGMMQFEYTE